MGILDWFSRKKEDRFSVDRSRCIKELSEFLAVMTSVDGPVLGMAAVQAAEVAERIYDETEGKVDLRRPAEALAAQPECLWSLTEGAIQLQKTGRQFEAVGPLIWTHTLRAELVPEIRAQVKQMWSLLDKGGFIYVASAEALFKAQTGRELRNNILFRGVPAGYEID